MERQVLTKLEDVKKEVAPRTVRLPSTRARVVPVTARAGRTASARLAPSARNSVGLPVGRDGQREIDPTRQHPSVSHFTMSELEPILDDDDPVIITAPRGGRRRAPAPRGGRLQVLG